MQDGIILCNANNVYLGTFRAIEGVITEALVLLPEYSTTGINRFLIRGVKNTISFLNYVALVVRVSATDKDANHCEVPVFSPAILAVDSSLSWRLEDDKIVEIEFNKTDEAVMWREQYPTAIPREYLIKCCYYFVRNSECRLR